MEDDWEVGAQGTGGNLRNPGLDLLVLEEEVLVEVRSLALGVGMVEVEIAEFTSLVPEKVREGREEQGEGVLRLIARVAVRDSELFSVKVGVKEIGVGTEGVKDPVSMRFPPLPVRKDRDGRVEGV